MALSQGRYEAESQLVRKDGSIFTSHDVVTPVHNDYAILTGYSKILRDISEAKQAKEKIQQLAEELEQRVRERTAQLERVNKELESFTHTVSHDLRAPLRNLAKLSQILLSRHHEQLDVESREYLNYILECSQQALQLSSALLDLSKVTSAPLKRQMVDLTQLAEEISKELQESDSKRQVEFKISKNLITSGDPILLKVALQNLLENAWKFTAKSPHAIIEFGVTKVEDGQMMFYIQDNGVGFDPDYSDKLFQAFQRLHSDDEFYGTGVGLATVYRIILRHEGRIWAKGAINQGATFFFSFSPNFSEAMHSV